MKIELAPELEQMIREKVEAGLYGEPAEVIAAALKLLNRQDRAEGRRAARLRAAIGEGEADIRAGRCTTINTREELEALFADL
jgi:antitoxin ParD1/3/4